MILNRLIVLYYFIFIVSTIIHGSQGASATTTLNQQPLVFTEKEETDLAIQILNFMNEIFPAPLQQLILKYAKPPLISPIIDADFPQKPCQTSAASEPKVTVAASAAAVTANADEAKQRVESASRVIAHHKKNVSNIVALPHNRFAIRRGTAIQTWQLQANDTATKEAHDHHVHVDGVYQDLTPLYDGTILAQTISLPMFWYGLTHWNNQRNVATLYQNHCWDHTSRHLHSQARLCQLALHPRITLPLSTGKILFFFSLSYKTFAAENVTALNKKLKRGRTLPEVNCGTVLAGDNVVLFHDDCVAVYDPAELMWQPNRRQRQRRDYSRDIIPRFCLLRNPKASIQGVAKTKDNSFMAWGSSSADSSHSFVEAWRLDGQKLKKIHQLLSNKWITNAAVTRGRCIALCEEGTAQICDLTPNAQWEDVPNCTDAHSLTTLSNGTVLIAHKNGSISTANKQDRLLEAFISRQQQNIDRKT